jgi:hypothetical protein
MIENNIQEKQTRVKALIALKIQCNDTEVKAIGYQDNDKLISLLDAEYPKLFSPVKNQILALVAGKKALTKVGSTIKITLEDKLMGNCFLLHIKPLDKSGKLLPFNKLSAKITKEINLLNKELESNSLMQYSH